MTLAYAHARNVKCPTCGALPQSLCFITYGPRRGAQMPYHPRRVRLAALDLKQNDEAYATMHTALAKGDV